MYKIGIFSLLFIHLAIYWAFSMCQIMKSPESAKMNGAWDMTMRGL